MKANQMQTWQKDETQITTDRVQVWGETMIARVTNAEAREMVRNGTHFVITEQAIGAMEVR